MTIKSKVFKVMSWAVGAALVSSIAWAAVNWKVDSFGNIKVARSSVLLQAGESSNCKLQYSGSALSIVGSDGNALSASNPCLIGMPNGAAPLEFTAPVSTTFGAASDTDGNLLGISEANWANDMPWFLHACQGNTQNYFAFSRNPARISSGAAAADMCQEGDTDCDDQGDMFIMTSGLTLADEVDKSCVTVGSFRTTYATAGNAWTVTALTSQDGFGRFQEAIKFTFPTGQNGAQAGHYTTTDGPTWATPANYVYEYSINKEGWVSIAHTTGSAGACTNGGAGSLRVTNPYEELLGGMYNMGVYISTINNTSTPTTVTMAAGASMNLRVLTAGGSVANNDFVNANDDISIRVQYKAF